MSVFLIVKRTAVVIAAYISPSLNIFGLQVEVAKKKVKKVNIPVVGLVYGAMEASDVQKAVEKEFEMALQDRVMEDTKDKKNAVEAYIYDMRNKVDDLRFINAHSAAKILAVYNV